MSGLKIPTAMCRVSALVLALIASSLTVTIPAQETTLPVNAEEAIGRATVRMAVTYAVGWQYSGNVWKKGVGEPAEVGQSGTPDLTSGVRAVCLGQESIDGADYYVFFCLRSFVDPFYPSPVIQKSDFDIYGPDGSRMSPPAKVDLSPQASEKLTMNWLSDSIRYGRIEFTSYAHLGAGKFKVVSKTPVTVFHDPGEVKVVNGEWLRHPKESYNGGVYPVPNIEFGVSEHFAMQEDAKQGRVAGLRFYEDHDAILIYVPKAAYLQNEHAEIPFHLGLNHPTVAVDLALRRPDQLFGFPFVLMGQETLEQIRDYLPPEYEGAGYVKAFNLLCLAMDPRTLSMLEGVDAALDALLPDPSKIASWNELRLYYATLNGSQLGEMGAKLLNEMLSPGREKGGTLIERLFPR